MYARGVILEVLKLAGEGITATEIARRTAVPRSTIRTWIRGDVPRTAGGAGRSDVLRCESCLGSDHDFAGLPREYVYLLGLYLGDGCISSHPRGVYRLRVTLDACYPGIIDECERSIRTLLPDNKIGRVVRGGGFVNSREESTIEVSATRARGPACCRSTARAASTSVRSSSPTGRTNSWTGTRTPCCAG